MGPRGLGPWSTFWVRPKHTTLTQVGHVDQCFDIFWKYVEAVWEHLGCAQGVVKGH